MALLPRIFDAALAVVIALACLAACAAVCWAIGEYGRWLVYQAWLASLG